MSQNFELLSQLEVEPALGDTIPKPQSETAIAADNPQTAFVNQELTNLAQAVFLSRNGDGPHEVVICGVDEESASSAICLALGRILARCSGQPVCLVDANIRTSRLSHLLNKDRLAAVPIAGWERAEKVEKDLWLTSIAAFGSMHADSLAPRDLLKKYLDDLRESFAFILIDAPGVSARGDAAMLSQFSSGAILVIEANSTRKAAALKAKKALEDMNVRLLGCVLNNRTFPIPEKLYRRL
jgi:protein-tyrosine kinase